MRGKSIITFIAGAAAGAIIGILLAPDKGSETRKKIREKLKDIEGNLSESIDGIKQKFEYKK